MESAEAGYLLGGGGVTEVMLTARNWPSSWTQAIQTTMAFEAIGRLSAPSTVKGINTDSFFSVVMKQYPGCIPVTQPSIRL